jgi:hypothetical protein
MTTLYKISEEILKLLNAGNIQAASTASIGEIKIAVCQVANSLLKTEHFSVNEKMGEKIPNGSVVATYEGIAPTSTAGSKSEASLPAMPLKLPRGMGVWAVYLTENPDNQFIPLQMGQSVLIQSQPQLSELLGQIGYETRAAKLRFTKDLPLLFPNKTLTVELILMDISEYDDYQVLPLLPEHEWEIKQQVYKLYAGVGIPDKLVDSSNADQQNLPTKQQQQP